MVYEANRFWLKDAEKSNAPINDPVSIFDTPLFQPLWQRESKILGWRGWRSFERVLAETLIRQGG
jgi:hypothetical protein